MGNQPASLLDALARNPLARIALAIVTLGLAATLAIGIVQNIYAWRAAAPPPFIATIDVWKLGMVIGSAGTATALLITLYVADRNYRRSREHIPSLSMTLEIRRIPASAQYDAVIAILNAKNTGTGLAEIGPLEWTLRALSPYDDAEIDQLAQTFEDDPGREFPWRAEKRASTMPGIVIEPNQTEQMTCDFLVSPEITAIVVSVWVSNASLPAHTEGWYCRSVHNIR